MTRVHGITCFSGLVHINGKDRHSHSFEKCIELYSKDPQCETSQIVGFLTSCAVKVVACDAGIKFQRLKKILALQRRTFLERYLIALLDSGNFRAVSFLVLRADPKLPGVEARGFLGQVRRR